MREAPTVLSLGSGPLLPFPLLLLISPSVSVGRFLPFLSTQTFCKFWQMRQGSEEHSGDTITQASFPERFDDTRLFV